LNIQMELVDVAQVAQLWGQQYDRSLTDILPMEERIARDISDRLRLKLSVEEQRRLTKHDTENPQAHLLYLKGRGAADRHTEEGRLQARRYFEEAIALDSQYALAYAGSAYATLTSFALSPREAYPIEKSAIDKALAIDDTLAEAHNALAVMQRDFNEDWSAAEKEFKRAIALNPANVDAHHGYSHFLEALGRSEESLAESLRALEIDPLDPVMHAHLGWHYLHGNVDQAIVECRKALEIGETYQGHHYLGLAYEQQARYEEAIVELNKARALSPGNLDTLASLGHAYAVSGRHREAQQVLDELERLSEQRYVSRIYKAYVYAGLGDPDEALKWLQAAYDERAVGLRDLGVDPRLDNLRSDPRFTDLLRRLGLAHTSRS
jgi:tetratricopeptide (TPR) repeat protein